jgi:hypothetical protein
MSVTLGIINAQVGHLIAHPWSTGIIPHSVIPGPIPPGNIVWPIIGVFTDTGAETGNEGLDRSESREVFCWTLASALGLVPLHDTFTAHILWRDEAKTLMRRAIDSYWGLSSAVTKAGINVSWESALYELPGPGEVGHIVATTIKSEVEYREQF